jgi:hypothetical protein
MLTTGAKLYLGLAALAAVALGVLGWATSWQMQATVGAASVLVVFLFLAGLMLYVRDANVFSLPAADETPAPAPRHAAWGMVAAFGAALAAIGLGLDTRLFIVGMVVAGLAALEWVVQSWADRASADPVYNDRVRGRLMHPLEFPVAGLLGGGLIVFGFSRVMVALSKEGALVAFAVLGIIVMGIAVILGTRPRVSRAVVGGVLSVSAIVALAAGIAGIGAGERTFHPHETECTQREEGSLTVSDKASVAAIVTFEDDALDPDAVVIGRSTVQTMIFKNLSDDLTKLVVQAGERDVLDSAGQALTGPDGETITEPVEFCTDLVRPNTQQALTVNFVEPGVYRMEAQDEEGTVHAEGSVRVP